MITAFRKTCARWPFGFYARNERGATAVEYGLMVSLIALVIVVAVTAFGSSVLGLFALIVAQPPFNH
jgi:Flp pilus assembly pilin Flp